MAVNGKRVLVVDDESLVLDFVERFLARNGFEVKTALSAQAAIELLENFIPDIMILDISMPKVNGYDLARSLRKDDRYSGIPIAFLSGHDIEWDAGESFEAGGEVYIRKPFSGEALIEAVKAVIAIGATEENTTDEEPKR